MCLPEMTSVGARTRLHKERMTHVKDRTPHTGAPTDTEQQDIPHHHETNTTLCTHKGTKAYSRPSVHTHDTQDKYLFTFTLFHPNRLPH